MVGPVVTGPGSITLHGKRQAADGNREKKPHAGDSWAGDVDRRHDRCDDLRVSDPTEGR